MDKKLEYSKFQRRYESSYSTEIYNPTFTEKSFKNQKRQIFEIIQSQRTKSVEKDEKHNKKNK